MTVASLVVVLGLVLLSIAGYRALRPASQPPVASAGENGTGDANWDGPTTRAVGPSTPVSVTVPKIDVNARLTKLSMRKTGVLDAPNTGDMAGWYRSSPTPGQRGASVIAGHVDWTDGPAVFYRLGKLTKGDRVAVRRADGRVATFAVHATRQYAKNDFPSRLVYRETRSPQLRLITCGGSFSGEHYVDNIVVFAHLVKVSG